MPDRLPPQESMIESTFAWAGDLYARIGDFLSNQRLAPTPGNYAFAHAVVSGADKVLAAQVAHRTDGGVRLTQRDISELGVQVDAAKAAANRLDQESAERLAAQAQAQMEGFVGIVQAMHGHARDFGRDLVESADALERSREDAGYPSVLIDGVACITAAMIARLREAEDELEQAHREAEELRLALVAARGDALSDPLTGLPNRRALEQAFDARIAAGESPCVAVCDVDHFKRINDRFGHAVGDRVLRAIGLALSSACESQFVARYGGEEFAILFDGPLVGAVNTLEEARRAIATKRFRLRESDAAIGRITFSTGISLCVDGDTLASVFDRADALLYAAKAAGRDCIFSDGDIRD